MTLVRHSDEIWLLSAETVRLNLQNNAILNLLGAKIAKSSEDMNAILKPALLNVVMGSLLMKNVMMGTAKQATDALNVELSSIFDVKASLVLVFKMFVETR